MMPLELEVVTTYLTDQQLDIMFIVCVIIALSGSLFLLFWGLCRLGKCLHRWAKETFFPLTKEEIEQQDRLTRFYNATDDPGAQTEPAKPLPTVDELEEFQQIVDEETAHKRKRGRPAKPITVH